MATVYLSPVGNGQVFLAANALPANAGLINTYAAGTTTPTATYTTSAGTIQNANPIVLSAAGLATNEIWLISGQSYKFVVNDSLGTQIGPVYDNLSGINDPSALSIQQVVALKNFVGADPTGATDSLPALNTASASLGTKGGRIWIGEGRWLIDSANYNQPACVTLEGGFSDWSG